ncbi:MAG TPA: catalase family peroxidase [Myxococcota bacterium]|nr:catalase family peroxidase [Myxococcota bacterium]
MTPVKDDQSTALSRDVIQAFDDLNGLHPGFRPAHAKGILLSGAFTPSPGGSSLTRAPHLQRKSTPVTVRFSDFGGVPTVPDNDPNASPRGIGVRFHLGEHVHTDIIAHSVDGFPVRTAEEFVEFLRAVHASGPTTPRPTPIESFLAAHPAALQFVQVPKPLPSSFAKESFFAVNAYKFTNQTGVSRYGRYRIRPDGSSEYLDSEVAAAKSSNFLFDEIRERLAKAPTNLHIVVQLAAIGDVVDDSTVHWPEDRPQVEFGTIQLTGVIPNNEAEQRHIIFDPIPRVEGIDSSGDPLLEPRAAVYLMSGRRRRASGAK